MKKRNTLCLTTVLLLNTDLHAAAPLPVPGGYTPLPVYVVPIAQAPTSAAYAWYAAASAAYVVPRVQAPTPASIPGGYAPLPVYAGPRTHATPVPAVHVRQARGCLLNAPKFTILNAQAADDQRERDEVKFLLHILDVKFGDLSGLTSLARMIYEEQYSMTDSDKKAIAVFTGLKEEYVNDTNSNLVADALYAIAAKGGGRH